MVVSSFLLINIGRIQKGWHLAIFLTRRRVLTPRVVNDRCLVNCGTWESFSGDLRNGHLVISAEGCHKRKDICFN